MKKTEWIYALLTLATALPACAADYKIENYFGDSPLEFSLNEGKVKVVSYPKMVSGKLDVLQYPTVGLYKDLSEASCAAVETQAKLYADRLIPPSAKERILEKVRKANPVVIKWDAAGRLQPDTILEAVRTHLREQSVPFGNLTLQNQIVLDKASFKITADNDGITRHIGALEDVEKAFGEKFAASIVKTGSATGETAVMDVLCDAKSGKVKLTVSVSGVETGAEKGRAVVDATVGKEMADSLWTYRDKFTAGDDRAEFGANRVRATALILSAAAKRGLALEDKDLLFLVGALTDAQTGRPVSVEGQPIEKFVTVYEKGIFAFDATSSTRF